MTRRSRIEGQRGRVIARCPVCQGEAISDGTFRPVFISHAEQCPEKSTDRPRQSYAETEAART